MLTIINAIKELKEPLLEIQEKIDLNNLVELCEFIEENCLSLGLPSMQMSKKLEKNFYHAQKYFVYEKLDDTDDMFEFFAHAISLVLLEKNMCIMPVNLKLSSQNSLARIHEIYEVVKDKLNQNVVELIDEAWEILQGQIELDKNTLVEVKKIAKKIRVQL